MIENIPDFLERYDRNMRFLFKLNGKHNRLFFVIYENDELYLGSSLKKIRCSGQQGIGDVIIDNNKFGIFIDTQLQEEEYKSLKFSFHKSGERHLRCKNKSNVDIDFYKVNAIKLDELTEPEMLFIMISKRISFYQEYTSENLIRDEWNAIILDTPIEYSNCKNVFEFYITNDPISEITSTIIPNDIKKEKLIVKLKDNVFLHIKYFVNIPENHAINIGHPEREILLFKDNGVLKYFSFK
ncbi:MAG: hypothetical protein HY951_07015 [Bacteroidia bacterium]|nr:hypothetical protein [Bacteroidia bacterium]